LKLLLCFKNINAHVNSRVRLLLSTKPQVLLVVSKKAEALIQ
jgi:hypothetical protein